MRINTGSILLAILATVTTISYAQDQTSSAPAATGSAAVCKRDFDAPGYLVVRDHQWGKRVEKNIPGKLAFQPLQCLGDANNPTDSR